MSDDCNLNLKRRDFITSLSGVALGTGILLPDLLRGEDLRPVLTDTLSEEEKKLVEKSVMAKNISDFFGKGYSCAEAGLMVALRYLKKPEAMVWAACGFGGGMGQKDLCGFLTGGIMGIGIAAGELDIERTEAKKICSAAIKKYWQWWKTMAPVHCRLIRQPGSKRGICTRLGFLSAANVEELIRNMQKS